MYEGITSTKTKFSGRFTASVPKRHAHHHRFNSQALLDRLDRARNVDSCSDPFLLGAQFSHLADWRWLSKSANPPIFFWLYGMSVLPTYFSSEVSFVLGVWLPLQSKSISIVSMNCKALLNNLCSCCPQTMQYIQTR